MKQNHFRRKAKTKNIRRQTKNSKGNMTLKGHRKAVYSGIFRYIQEQSAIFSHVQANIQTSSDIARDIKA